MPAQRGDTVSRDDLVAFVLEAVYPVGAIYLSTNSTSPSTLFGGTWVQLKDTFLLSAGDTYTAGDTGGEATHTLVTKELPSHAHGLNSHTHSLNSHTHSLSSHTHSLSSHTHSLSNHTHGVWPKYYLGRGTPGYNGQSLVGTGDDRTLNHWNAMPSVTSDGPSNNTSGGPSNNTSGGPSNNTSGGPSNNNSGGPSVTNTANEGSNNAHNNMPPYLVVYAWKRTE